MADAHRRTLERRAKTGGAEDLATLLVERMRAGELSKENLELAAWCGHSAARLALQEIAVLVCCMACAGTGHENASCGDPACCPDPAGAPCKICDGRGEYRKVDGPNNLPTDVAAFAYALTNRGAAAARVAMQTVLQSTIRNRPDKTIDALAWRLQNIGELPRYDGLAHEHVGYAPQAMAVIQRCISVRAAFSEAARRELHEELRQAAIAWALT